MSMEPLSQQSLSSVQFSSSKATESVRVTKKATQMPEEIKTTLPCTNPLGEEVTQIPQEFSLYTEQSVVPSRGLKL